MPAQAVNLASGCGCSWNWIVKTSSLGTFKSFNGRGGMFATAGRHQSKSGGLKPLQEKIICDHPNRRTISGSGGGASAQPWRGACVRAEAGRSIFTLANPLFTKCKFDFVKFIICFHGYHAMKWWLALVWKLGWKLKGELVANSNFGILFLTFLLLAVRVSCARVRTGGFGWWMMLMFAIANHNRKFGRGGSFSPVIPKLIIYQACRVAITDNNVK